MLWWHLKVGKSAFCLWPFKGYLDATNLSNPQNYLFILTFIAILWLILWAKAGYEYLYYTLLHLYYYNYLYYIRQSKLSCQPGALVGTPTRGEGCWKTLFYYDKNIKKYCKNFQVMAHWRRLSHPLCSLALWHQSTYRSFRTPPSFRKENQKPSGNGTLTAHESKPGKRTEERIL